MSNKMQWVKGEKLGKIETVVDVDGEWTVFEDGGRINSNLINEFLIPVDEKTELVFESPAQIVKQNSTETKTIQNEKSPIRQLLDAQRQTAYTKLKISFSLKIPEKDIFNIINNTFDSNNVNTELKNYILDQIKETIISNEINTGVDDLIKTYYK